MQVYLRRSRLSMTLNRILGAMLACVVCVLLFLCLFGLRAGALAGGLCLFFAVSLLLRAYAARALKRQEKRMRERIGGELQLETMLLMPRPGHHALLGDWLCQAYPLTQVAQTAEGVLAQYGAELLLLRCVSRHQSLTATAQEVLGAVRACTAIGANRVVLCATCQFSKEAQQLAADVSPSVTLLTREHLIALSGKLYPATDEQLLALKQKKRHPMGWRALARQVLHRKKARRYFSYASGLLLLYVFTGLSYYPLPAAILLLLGALSLFLRPKTPPGL